MTTLHRRRQYRDRRARKPLTFEDLMQIDFYIGLHIAITGCGFALLVLTVIFGDRFAALFGG